MTPPRLRIDTSDAAMWNMAYRQNQYRIGDLTGLVVLDCGAHIGSFARKCLDHDAKQVFCVEPCKETFAVLAENLLEFHATLRNAAVWDAPGTGRLGHCQRGHASDSLLMLGVGGETCELVSLQSLLEECSPDVVKLNIEGAEYAALKDVILPARVKTLWVEFHNVDSLVRDFVRLLDDLYTQGFTSRLLQERVLAPAFPVYNVAYLFRFDRTAQPKEQP